MSNLSQEEYDRILSTMPVLCVDVIVARISPIGAKELLFVRRAEDPAKDCLYPVGGRMRKGELSDDAAKRKVMEETGLSARIDKLFGFYETIYATAQRKTVQGGVHTASLGYLAFVKSSSGVRLDRTSTGYEWIRKDDLDSLPPYSRQLVEDSRVFRPTPIGFVARKMDIRECDFSQYAVRKHRWS